MGTRYVYFTEEEKVRANEVDLPEFLLLQGERLIPSGRDYRLASNHSVTLRGSKWYDHATGEGGQAIDFVRWYMNASFPEAVEILLGRSAGQAYRRAEETTPEKKPFLLPEKNDTMRRVYAYMMQQRCIDREIISFFAREGTLYEEKYYHSVVFAGKDEHGVFRHAHLRGTVAGKNPFRSTAQGSQPQYSFHHIGGSKSLLVFEAPIDMLSFLSLYPQDWQTENYVALCGLSPQAAEWILETNPKIEEVILCLDNDDAGRKAAQKMIRSLSAKKYYVTTAFPERKDWNEDLKHYAERGMKDYAAETNDGICDMQGYH